MLFIVHATILTRKADILTNTHIFTTFFHKKTVLTASKAADGGRHHSIENCISIRHTKKGFYGSIFKITYKTLSLVKHEKYHILGTF